MVIDLKPPKQASKTIPKYTSILSTTPNTSFTEDKDALSETAVPSTVDLSTRLENLRPSRELLEFYRKKIAEYDDHHSDLFDKINQIENTCDQNMKLETELRNRDQEVANLQKALSDLQSY